VEYEVVNVEKVGNCTMHYLNKEVPDGLKFDEIIVKGVVDAQRRRQLISHHTGTHIVFAAARKVLGPHVWQNGAKKTIEKAHLDITHFQSLSFEEELAIENEANRIIMDSINIKKYFMNKKEAELNYGFSLYQGGVVPGNNLRIVQIENTDVEACCGTHCDNTAEVGWIKMKKSSRISDGIVRLEYVCYERALDELNEESEIINELCESWGIERSAIVKTGNRFFDDFKRFSNKAQKQEDIILSYQMKLLEARPEKLFFHVTDQDTVGYFMSNFNEVQAKKLKELGKGIIFLNKGYIYGLIGSEEIFSEKDFNILLETTKVNIVEKQKEKEEKKKEKVKDKETKDSKEEALTNTTNTSTKVVKEKQMKNKVSKSIGKKKDTVEGILNFSSIYDFNVPKAVQILTDKGGYEL
jgi:alanyl-tRNA synthetase